MISTRFCTVVVAYLSVCAFSSANAAGTAWERYLDFPSAENARLVHKMAYSSHKNDIEEGAAGDLAILRTQVVAGDRAAFDLTYLLMQSADGGVLEDLQAILASAIRSQPEMFLLEVGHLNPSEETLKSILLMPGLEYVDRLRAQRYELEMRRRAINALGRKDTRSIRRRCLAIYEKGLREGN